MSLVAKTSRGSPQPRVGVVARGPAPVLSDAVTAAGAGPAFWERVAGRMVVARVFPSAGDAGVPPSVFTVQQ